MPTRKIITLKRIILLAVLLGIVSMFMPMLESSPTALKNDILTKVADADRIAIDPTILPDRFGGPAIQVPGHDKVFEVLGLIDFKRTFCRSRCMCIGEVAIRFYHGNRELLALTLHHSESLRVLDANWGHNRNMYLTPESQVVLKNWLTKNGYRPSPTSSSAAAP